jgi:hypothetical protein
MRKINEIQRSSQWLSQKALQYAYENTGDGSMLRNFLVRVLGDHLDGDIALNQDRRSHLLVLPKELLLDWIAYLDMIRCAQHCCEAAAEAVRRLDMRNYEVPELQG